MQNSSPRFTFRSKSPASNSECHIEMEQKVIHVIDNLSIFYKEFGYSAEFAKHGTLADEFIWKNYIDGRAAKYSACYQLHIIEYLRNHSRSFVEQYGEQSKLWIAEHTEARKAGGEPCYACKMKLFCEEPKEQT